MFSATFELPGKARHGLVYPAEQVEGAQVDDGPVLAWFRQSCEHLLGQYDGGRRGRSDIGGADVVRDAAQNHAAGVVAVLTLDHAAREVGGTELTVIATDRPNRLMFGAHFSSDHLGAEWAAQLVAGGLSAATARRAVSTMRSIFEHAIADDRVAKNPAAKVKALRGSATREGQALTEAEVWALADACRGPLSDVVVVLAYTGLRWGELAGLKISDRVGVPGPGLRVQRAALAGGGRGDLYIDSLKNHQARTVPLTSQVAPIIAKWAASRPATEWIFPSAAGTPLREGNWKRSVGWTHAKGAIGKPTLRVHDLRHTAASIWLGAGADVKVVQRILGHASATMTVDLYGHMIDTNLWENAARVGGPSGDHSHQQERNDRHGTR